MRKRNTPGDVVFCLSHFLAHYNNIMPENRLKYAVGFKSDGLSDDRVSKSDADEALDWMRDQMQKNAQINAAINE